MTVSDNHPAQPDDPLASQRADLLRELKGARAELNRVMVELIRSGASTSAADSQLSLLAGLQASIGTADAATLHALGGAIATAVAQSKTLADQAREQATAAAAGSAVALAEAARASRVAVDDAMNSLRHIPLTFASPQDEADYRTREDERARYIAAQQAKHTPSGDLNAAGGGLGQMVDAKAHGASGPEFDKQWNTLVTTTERLREQVRASGGSAKEFDEHLRNDLRQIMKSKGLTDADIDASFAANPDPLEAAKAFVQGNDDIRALGTRAQSSADIVMDHAKASYSAPAAAPQPTDQSAMSLDTKAIAAKMKASGIAMDDHPPDAAFAHGMAENGKSEKAQRALT